MQSKTRVFDVFHQLGISNGCKCLGTQEIRPLSTIVKSVHSGAISPIETHRLAPLVQLKMIANSTRIIPFDQLDTGDCRDGSCLTVYIVFPLSLHQISGSVLPTVARGAFLRCGLIAPVMDVDETSMRDSSTEPPRLHPTTEPGLSLSRPPHRRSNREATPHLIQSIHTVSAGTRVLPT